MRRRTTGPKAVTAAEGDRRDRAVAIWTIRLAACLLLLAATAFWSAGVQAATGLWATEGGKSHVEIAPCGEKLCGSIVWLKEPLDDEGAAKTDKNNPDEALRDRPIVGLPLLAGFVPGEAANEWVDGTIYNPEDGETYSCTMTLQSDGSLKVRGYVGLPIFGKSQIWTPAN